MPSPVILDITSPLATPVLIIVAIEYGITPPPYFSNSAAMTSASHAF